MTHYRSQFPQRECPACGGEGIGGGEWVPPLCGEGEDQTCERCGGAGRVKLPWHYEVCPRCEGRGTQCKLGAMTGDEYRDMLDGDPDFPEDYKSGLYDEPCRECHGQRVVPVITRERCRPAELEAYDREQQEQADFDECAAMERRYER